MAYDVTEERLKVKGSESITRDLQVNGTAYINDLEVRGTTFSEKITATDIAIDNDLFVNNNAIIAGDLEVRGTTFSSEVENVQADGDWIVLRANNQTPLANEDYAGFVFHNYNNAGKDAAITVDNTGTFRISTQTTEAISPLSNTWLVDEQYFHSNVDFSQATLFTENYPVTRYQEVFTDIEAYKSGNNHYFYDPNAATIEYYDNVVFNTVLQKVELAGNVVSFTPDPSVDTSHEVHFYTSISFMEPQASDMEAIATRDETSNWSQNEIAMYDKSTEKFVGVGMPVNNNDVLSANIDNTNPQNPVTTYGWKSPVSSIFDIIYPVGVTYNQYPGQASPNTLWGALSTWQELNFGGAFFRANGGNASSFEASKTVSRMSGTSITINAHGLTVGSVLYDKVHNEARVITAITNANVVVVNAAFSYSNITNLLITQNSQNVSHTHSEGSAGSHSHTTNTLTNSSGTAITTTGNQSANPSFSWSGSHHHLQHVSNNDWQQVDYDRAGNAAGYPSQYQNKISDRAATYTAKATITVSGTTSGNHNHNFEHKHGTDSQGSHTHTINSSGGTEARPVDFTYKIWVRVS